MKNLFIAHDGDGNGYMKSDRAFDALLVMTTSHRRRCCRLPQQEWRAHAHSETLTETHRHTQAGAFIMLAHNVGAWIRHLRRNNRFNSNNAGISRHHL